MKNMNTAEVGFKIMLLGGAGNQDMSNYTGKSGPFHSQIFFFLKLISKQNTGNFV